MEMSEQKTDIQKHHLQLTRSVNRPPITGPELEHIPKTLITIPIYSGLFSSGEMYVIMPKAPWISPAAPIPATALPTMKAAEVDAVAQTIDPTG